MGALLPLKKGKISITLRSAECIPKSSEINLWGRGERNEMQQRGGLLLYFNEMIGLVLIMLGRGRDKIFS